MEDVNGAMRIAMGNLPDFQDDSFADRLNEEACNGDKNAGVVVGKNVLNELERLMDDVNGAMRIAMGNLPDFQDDSFADRLNKEACNGDKTQSQNDVTCIQSSQLISNLHSQNSATLLFVLLPCSVLLLSSSVRCQCQNLNSKTKLSTCSKISWPDLENFDELVATGSTLLVDFQQGLEFLRRPQIDETSDLVKNIIRGNETKRVKSYVEAGCLNADNGKLNISNKRALPLKTDEIADEATERFTTEDIFSNPIFSSKKNRSG
ncbi:hypothetical protein COP1_020056 [Malus domestica]